MNRQIRAKFMELNPTRYTTNAINGLLAASKRLPDIFIEMQEKAATAGSMPQEEPQQATKQQENNQSGSNELNQMMGFLQGPFADALATHPIMTETIEEFAAGIDVIGFN